jgi:tight adherence protein C
MDFSRDTLVLVAIALCAFASALLLTLALWRVGSRARLAVRLRRLDDTKLGVADEEGGFIEAIADFSGRLSTLTLPEKEDERSRMRDRFFHAGWRQPRAPIAFFGVKTLLTVGLPLVALLVCLVWPSELSFSDYWSAMALSGAAGLFLPEIVLNRKIEARKRALFNAFPDALDLMIVCMEAGLSLEAALSRVAEEMASAYPDIASELQLVVLEMRAGRGRDVALRNLGSRNGVDEISSLVSTLIQADQFGGSAVDSLRIYSELLRTRRKQRAEEQAATIGTRLVFPLMLCILPTLLIVVAGPAFLTIAELLKGMAGGK